MINEQIKRFWNERNKQIIYFRSSRLCSIARNKIVDLGGKRIEEEEFVDIKKMTIQSKKVLKDMLKGNDVYREEFNRLNNIKLTYLNNCIEVADGCFVLSKRICDNNMPKGFLMKVLTTPIGRISLAESVVFMGCFLVIWEIVFGIIGMIL